MEAPALPPLQAVQVLDFRAGEIALLEVEQGRVWVTCDGLLEDYFLEAGQRLSFTGPVRLRVSAEGHRPARLSWAKHRAGKRHIPTKTRRLHSLPGARPFNWQTEHPRELKNYPSHSRVINPGHRASSLLQSVPAGLRAPCSRRCL